MKFITNLFGKKKDYIIHEIGGGDDDAYITFEIGGVVYMLLLYWESGNEIMEIEFGVEDDYNFNTTNQNKPYTVVNTVYKIVEDVMKLLKRKHHYKFSKISFSSSKNINGVEVDRGKKLRDMFFMRRILRDYPNATSKEVNQDLVINLNNKK